MAAPEPNLLDHMKDDTIWKAVGAIISTLFLGFVGLIRMLYHRDQKKIGTLFEWKDKTVDPALRELPEKYVLVRACERRHDELLTEIRESRRESKKEMGHLTGMLEKHLGINGGEGP